jgi:hypothetical protein
VDIAQLAHVAGLRPSGLVFHGSRCGSTLLAAVLRALDASLVLAEVPVLDEALSAAAPAARRGEWLRWLVAAHAQPDSGARRCFVKLDSWSVLELPVVRAAVPEGPWVFLYRRPEEVLRSHLRMRGRHMVPGELDPALVAPAGVDAGALPAAEYCARVLATIYDRAARHGDDDAGLYMSYDELVDRGAGRVLEHFGIVPTPAERARMAAVLRVDAKTPQLAFEPDRRPPSTVLVAAAERWVAEPYARLETLRREAAGPC